MKFVKFILTGIVGMFVIITLLSLLIPSKVIVTRTVIINNVSKAKVIDQLSDFNNWKQWHPLFKYDSSKIKVITISHGKQLCEINYLNKIARLQTNVVTDSLFSFTVKAEGENDIDNQLSVIPIPGQQNVQVNWRAINRLKWYPWQKFYGIFIDHLTGNSYDSALHALKDRIERK